MAKKGSTDPYRSSRKVLLHMNGSNGGTTFTDDSTVAATVTRNGTPTTSTTPSGFLGTACGSFNGSTDFLTLPYSTNYDLPGDFTIHIKVRFASIANNYQPIVQFGLGANSSPAGTEAWGIIAHTQGGNLLFDSYDGTTDTQFAFAWAPSANTWYDILISRSGTSLRAFVNGSQIGTTQTTSFAFNHINTSDPLTLGAWRGASQQWYLNGFLDEFYVIKGAAEFTSNFTPTTNEVPNS